ncbi:MAG: hypothetical protein Q4D88_04010 [Anaerococcus sp.]|nr:hypothetical protein [Anaerococcus sp.]
MLNLVRMERMRIFKSRSSFLILLAVVLTSLLTLGIVHFASKNISENVKQEEDLGQGQGEVSIDISTQGLEELGNDGGDFIVSSFSQKNYIIFMIIFASLFFTGPYTHGYIKNFIGIGDNKKKYIISTFLVAGVYTIITFILSALILTVLTPMINDGMFKIDDYRSLIKILFVQLLSHLSFLSVILLVASITRSLATSLLASLLYAMIFFNLLVGLVNKLIGLIFKIGEDFTISNFINIGNITNIGINSTNADLLRASLVALIIGILALSLASVIIKKKDI